MLRSTVTTIASAINYGVAMATTALVVHVASGGVLPAPATLGLVLAAGGVYALCTAALVQREVAERRPAPARTPMRVPVGQPALATVTTMRPRPQRASRDQAAMAFTSRSSSMSA